MEEEDGKHRAGHEPFELIAPLEPVEGDYHKADLLQLLQQDRSARHPAAKAWTP